MSAKLENLQFNFLAGKRTSDKHTEDNTKPKESQRIYLCEICDYEAVDKACIKKHNESVHKPKLNKQKKHDKSKDTEDLSCKQCSYKAIHCRDLNRHENQMHTQKEFNSILLCDDCEYSTQCKDTLRKHIQSIHVEPSRYFYSTSKKKDPRPTSEKKSYAEAAGSFSSDPLPCNLCDFKTKSIANLRNHKDEHQKQTRRPRHPFRNSEKSQGPPTFNGCENVSNISGTNLKCEKCKLFLTHKDELKLHNEFFHSETSTPNQL